MNQMIEQCVLTEEQRSLILKGIKMGKEEAEKVANLFPVTITNTRVPRIQYDMVNTYVKEQIDRSPHTQMKVIPKRAGFHPYIVIHDTIRNIFILVAKLPKNKYIFNPSKYRGEFASGNFERLMGLGMSLDELMGESMEEYQTSLPLETENQPFSIIVCYDGKSDSVYEGALNPNQQDWIYKEDITNYVNADHQGIATLNNYQGASDIVTPLKKREEEDIVISLKKR